MSSLSEEALRRLAGIAAGIEESRKRLDNLPALRRQQAADLLAETHRRNAELVEQVQPLLEKLREQIED